jgi:hypothetical protein
MAEQTPLSDYPFIAYMERTRRYYRAQGFDSDYTWAHHTHSPFTRLAKPLSESRVTLVTTAVPEPEIPKPVRRASSHLFTETPDKFDTDELSWDKDSTHTDDRQSYFPLEILETLVAEGMLGQLADHYHFVPTQYSQRATIEEDAPQIARACLEDGVDVAILIPI